jgi:hypothetical protein
MRYTRREVFGVASGLCLPAKAAQTSGTLVIPFEIATNRGSLLVRARIDRRASILLVDTGSSHTILRPEVAGVDPAALAPPRVGPGVMGDAVGREVNLEIGRYTSRRRVSVMDLSVTLSFYQEKIDGLLGMDFLLEFSQVAISLKSREMTLVR